MAQAKLYASDGTPKSTVELPEDLFGGEVNEGLLHEAVIVLRGNARQGTAKTKSRSEVSGSGKKPWKQKGTGRARSGTNKSPIWVRGGKAHGAIPRQYTRKLNKKVKRQALQSALSMKAQQGRVHIFESFDLPEAKTGKLAGILGKAELQGKRNLILTHQPDDVLGLACRNIPATFIGLVAELHPYAVLSCENLIFTQSALDNFSSNLSKMEAVA